jgi:hypothetical protein
VLWSKGSVSSLHYKKGEFSILTHFFFEALATTRTACAAAIQRLWYNTNKTYSLDSEVGSRKDFNWEKDENEIEKLSALERLSQQRCILFMQSFFNSKR